MASKRRTNGLYVPELVCPIWRTKCQAFIRHTHTHTMGRLSSVRRQHHRRRKSNHTRAHAFGTKLGIEKPLCFCVLRGSRACMRWLSYSLWAIPVTVFRQSGFWPTNVSSRHEKKKNYTNFDSSCERKIMNMECSAWISMGDRRKCSLVHSAFMWRHESNVATNDRPNVTPQHSRIHVDI